MRERRIRVRTPRMRLRSPAHALLTATLVVLSNLPTELVAQSGRPDDRTPASTKPSPPKSRVVRKPRPTRQDPPTTLTIRVNPSDSTVQVDNVVSDALDSSGTITLRSLKAMVTHFIMVRRAGFRDHAQTVELKRGVDNAISIVLDPFRDY